MITSREYGLLLLLVCAAVLALPVSVFAECRVVEYPDHNEVVCEDDVPTQAGQPVARRLQNWKRPGRRSLCFMPR